MNARLLFTVLAVLFAASAGRATDRGQAAPAAAQQRALLAIDESMFEIAAATGGFYYFWRPGEFAALEPQESATLFAIGGQTIAQIDGKVNGTLDIPFDVETGDADVTVRVGLQSSGEILLYAPGTAMPYIGNESARTAHMLVTRVVAPTPGAWTVRLAGSGLYLINVTAHGERAFESKEQPTGRASAQDRPAEHGSDDLWRFQQSSPEGRWDEFRRLPALRRRELARALLDHPDPTVAYVAAGSLARGGAIDEAVPVFARILVRGEDKTALSGRMGYDWIHDDDPELAERILHALRKHLRKHLGDYSPTERQRAETVLRR